LIEKTFTASAELDRFEFYKEVHELRARYLSKEYTTYREVGQVDEVNAAAL
jgi:hypothetical protein